MNLNKVSGWLGSICLAFCGAPEAYRALTAQDYSISIAFVILWMSGEVLVLIPVLREIKKPYLAFNYLANIFFIGIIILRLIVGESLWEI